MRWKSTSGRVQILLDESTFPDKLSDRSTFDPLSRYTVFPVSGARWVLMRVVALYAKRVLPSVLQEGECCLQISTDPCLFHSAVIGVIQDRSVRYRGSTAGSNADRAADCRMDRGSSMAETLGI